MRKAIIIAALAVSACLVEGCDFFRIVAGRPTSREIEAKRRLIALDADGQPLPADTLALEQSADTAAPAAPAQPEKAPEPQQAPDKASVKAPAGTPAAKPVDTRGAAVNTRAAATFGQSRPEFRYYVMIGSFSTRENAVRQAAKAQAAGYSTALIPFRGGLTAVGVSGSNDLAAVVASLEALRSESFCPKDAWILNVE